MQSYSLGYDYKKFVNSSSNEYNIIFKSSHTDSNQNYSIAMSHGAIKGIATNIIFHYEVITSYLVTHYVHALNCTPNHISYVSLASTQHNDTFTFTRGKFSY